MKSLSIDTYNLYAEYLNKRILDRQHLTEDSIRYSFFIAALQTTDIQQHEIVLELPHPKFLGKEVDTFILSAELRPATYIEFKFHRASKSTSAKPQKAGSLFKDFSRLCSIKTIDSLCLIVYVTDAEMAKYFDKNSIAYSGFWDYGVDSSFLYDEKFTSKTTDTFRRVSGDLHISKVSVAFSKQLLSGYHLRVFEVDVN